MPVNPTRSTADGSRGIGDDGSALVEPVAVWRFDELADRQPVGVALLGEELVIVQFGGGHTGLADLGPDDLTTFDREMHHLTGIAYAGVTT